MSKKNVKQNKENTIKDQTKLIQLLQKIKRDKLRTTRSQKRAEVPQQEQIENKPVKLNLYQSIKALPNQKMKNTAVLKPSNTNQQINEAQTIDPSDNEQAAQKISRQDTQSNMPAASTKRQQKKTISPLTI